MATFKEFAKALNDYKASVNWRYSHEDSKKFGFRMSKKNREKFAQYIDEEWTDAPDDVKNNFYSMFEDNKLLFGIQMLAPCNDNNIYLIQATEKKKEITLSNFACFGNEDIYKPQQITCPVIKKNFYWPQAIKQGSFHITDSERGYYDIKENSRWGLITFDMDRFEFNGLYISGKVNYQTGNIYLERYSKINEDQYDELIASPTKQYAKDSDTINLEFTVYEGPAKVIWTFDAE